MPPKALPTRGEFWRVRLDPGEGHEQAGERPALVVSVDRINQGLSGMVVVVPSTKRHRPELDAWRVEVEPPDGGLPIVSYLMPEHIRAVAAHRLISRYGRVRPKTLAELEDRLRILLNL
jgi:mRNA interferase MazF